MFKTYKELTDIAPQKGTLRLQEDNRIAPLRAVKFYSKGKRIPLPLINTVIIPEKSANNFIGAEHIDFLAGWGLLPHVKLKISEASYHQKLLCLDNEKFYAYALHHGYDFGHHGEPTVTGLFVHSKALEENPQTVIEASSRFYADLEKQEQRKAFQSKPSGNSNRKLGLEQKIRSLSDYELYSWYKNTLL